MEKKSVSKDTNNFAMNKLKLSENASKIVQAIKKLHVPSTGLTEGSDVGNGKRKLKLSNGVQLAHGDEKVKKNDEHVTSKEASARPEVKNSDVASTKVSSVKENVAAVISSNNKTCVKKNGERDKKEENSQNDEEWQVLDEISDASLETSPGRNQSQNTSSTSENVKARNTTRDSSDEKLENSFDSGNLTSLKRNSPVVFESTAKEEGMQKAVNKVVEKLLNELPVGNELLEDMTGDEGKKYNVKECRLYAELTKDTNGNKRAKCDSDGEDRKSAKKSNEDKEIGVHSELRMKIDLKRKQANYIESDDKHSDILTVKKVKLDSDVLNDEEKKSLCAKQDAKIDEEKSDVIRISSKEIYLLVDKFARQLLSHRTTAEVGELKAKVEMLEKKVAYWKKQCWLLQKEVTECNIGVQRVNQNLKKNISLPPVKVSTRSVCLQVQQRQQPIIPSLPNRAISSNNLVPIQAAPIVVKRQEVSSLIQSTAKIIPATITATTVTPPKKVKRYGMTLEERRKWNRERKKYVRLHQSEEQSAAERERSRLYQIWRRKNQTQEELAAERERNRQYQALKRSNQTQEELAAERERNRNYQAFKRSNQTQEEMAAERERQRKYQALKRSNQTEEELAAEKEQNRKYQALKRSNLTREEIIAEREKSKMNTVIKLLMKKKQLSTNEENEIAQQELAPSVSVSILQNKSQNNITIPSNLLVTTAGGTVIPKVASVVAPTTVATVRSTLDLQRKVQVVEVALKNETSKTVSIRQSRDSKMAEATSTQKQLVVRQSAQSKFARPNEVRHQIDLRKQSPVKHLPSAHTLSLTAAALRIFRRFLVSVGEIREIIALSTTKLNSYMARFFATGKKKDGSEYGANTLTCVFDSIERHLRMHNYPASVKKDEVFHIARENLRLKRRQLQKKKQTVRCITYYENGKFRTRSWSEFTEGVASKKSDNGLGNTESIDDIKLFTSWKNGAPLNDLRALFHLDVFTLNAYLAQFFIWIHKDEKGEIISSSRLERFHNTLDAYMKELSYPMSIKCNSFFKHSMECKDLKEKLFDGQLEKIEVVGKSETEDAAEASDCEDADPLSSVLEPEVSLVEDDNEIVLDLDGCKSSASDGCNPVSGILKTFLESSEVREKGDIMKIPPDSLDHLLANFYVNSVIDMDAIQLTDFHQSINKYLRESGYPLSIEDDSDFVYSQLCLSSRQAYLLRIIELPHKKFISQLHCLSQLGAVGIADPIGLVSCLWCHISHEFLLATTPLEHAQLQWNQVHLKVDSSNNECLEYKGKVLKKLEDKYANICPVEAYKVLMKSRPCNEKCNGCKNFYLCVSTDYSWFRCKALVSGHIELIARYVDDVMDAMKNRTGAELEISNFKAELFKKLQSRQEEILLDSWELRSPTPITPISGELSDQKVKEVFVAGGHAPNTIIKTMHDVNVFRDWLSVNGFERNFASVSALTLNQMLLKFFANLKKRDGSDYEPNSLNSIYFSIDRYLRVQQYPANIKSDSAFLECRNFFSVKRKEYDADKDPIHIVQRRQVDISFTDDDIDCLRKKRLLGPFNPDAMLLALWHMNTVTLGIHSQRAQLHMLWGDFQLLKDVDGREFIEYHQCATKAKLISCPPNGMSTLINKRPLKAYATPHKLDSCPVELFKKFQQCRPPTLLNGDSRFYLYPADTNCTFWFRDSPLGRSKFASLPATIWKLVHEAREEKKMKTASEVKQIPRLVVKKPEVKQPVNNDATTLKCQNSPSISLIPLFPTQSTQKKSDKNEQTLTTPNVMPTQSVVLFPVVSAPTTENVVQIIPLISTMATQQQQRNSTLFITSDKL